MWYVTLSHHYCYETIHRQCFAVNYSIHLLCVYPFVYVCSLNPLRQHLEMANIYKEGIYPVERDGVKLLECYESELRLLRTDDHDHRWRAYVYSGK